MTKRILAIILALAFVLSLLSFSALATATEPMVIAPPNAEPTEETTELLTPEEQAEFNLIAGIVGIAGVVIAAAVTAIILVNKAKTNTADR